MINFCKKPLFSIHGFGFIFTFNLVPSFVFLCLLALLLRLGFWQLDRAHLKKKVLHNYQVQHQLPATTFTPNRVHSPYTKVKLEGYYDNAHTFLLDNSFWEHQVGFQVFTPFLIPHYSKPILVNRGWIPRKLNSRLLPSVPPIAGNQSLTGLITEFPTKSFILAKQPPSSQWPQVIERLKQSEIEQLLGRPIDPHLILLSPSAKSSFKSAWVPQFGIPPERHFAYAFQWFALALTLVIIYLIYSVHREKHGTH